MVGVMKTPYTKTPKYDIPKSQSRGVFDSGEGSSAPRLVIRGESIPTPSRDVEFSNTISSLDFLGFTYFPDEPLYDEFPLRDLLADIFNIPPTDWQRTKSGWHGYDTRINLDVYGLIAFGGGSQKNTVHIELSGTGCSQVKDWLLVHDWFVTTDSRITRIDIAHDDLNGDFVSVKNAIRWSEEGLFNSRGRPPNRHLRDDFDSGEGKTFYVGKRGNDKFARIYEKGKQLGDPLSPWCRAEVEFKAKSKIIPHDVFLHPDTYLAGAYKAFEYLSAEQSKFKSIQKEKELSLIATTDWGKSTIGPLVNLLCHLNDEDHSKVIGLLRRPEIPKSLAPLFKRKLQESGLLP